MRIGKKRRVVDDKVLEVAQAEMKKRVARELRAKKFRRFYWLPAAALMLIFCFFSPWIFTTGINNQMENDFIWRTSLLPVESASFNDLTPKRTKSIIEISKLKKEPISSLVRTSNKQTTAFILNDEIVLLKEYSRYNEVECYLFVMNRTTTLSDFSLSSLNYIQSYEVNNRRFFFEYNEGEQTFYLEIMEDYHYYLKVHTNEIVILEEILGLFSEN